MRQFKIDIEVSNCGGVYSADNLEEANEIAEEICNKVYAQLNGRASVIIANIEEIVE